MALFLSSFIQFGPFFWMAEDNSFINSFSIDRHDAMVGASVLPHVSENGVDCLSPV